MKFWATNQIMVLLYESKHWGITSHEGGMVILLMHGQPHSGRVGGQRATSVEAVPAMKQVNASLADTSARQGIITFCRSSWHLTLLWRALAFLVYIASDHLHQRTLTVKSRKVPFFALFPSD